MSALLRLLAPYIAGALAGLVAGVFEHACPLDASTWVCGHWVTICVVAGYVLGALGRKIVPWKGDGVAVARSGLRAVPPPPPGRPAYEDPSSDPIAPATSNLDQTPVTLDDPSGRGG